MRHFLTLSLIVSAAAVSHASVVNGDFEAGNTGFTSGYTYVAPASNSLVPEGVYTVDTDAHNSHDLFASFGDHTSGTGNYMIVNGATVSGTNVWTGSTSTELVAGKTYEFSVWVANAHSDSLASLVFSINGVELAGSPRSVTGLGEWQQFTSKFVAASDGYLTLGLEIGDLNTAFQGNDFALDDVDVQAVPEPASMAVLGMGAMALIRRRRNAK